MKTGNKKMKITKKDAIKAIKIAGREMDLENSTGWVAIRKVHKSDKNYTRKMKHKKSYLTY